MKKWLCCALICCFAIPLSARGQETHRTPAAIEAQVDSLLNKLTLEEKIDLLGGVDDFYTRDIQHIGLPRLKMADGPFGVRNYGPSTAFGGIGLAATWDCDLARRLGVAIGQDARARGVHFVLGPGVNIYRAPMNGRNFEYYGEDPFLASRIAVGYIEGMQSQGVSATIKHFVGNNQEFDRHNMDSLIDERTLRELYLPVFEAAVKEAHVGAIMDSYNLLNGVHMSQNGALNTNMVKNEWGFDGIIVSDWDSTYDGVAVANGGMDLEMPSGKFMNRASLLPAIQSGKLSLAVIDDKVRRILRTAIRFGWLDRAQTDLSIPLLNMNGRRAALEAARSGMVLLKNEGSLLPFDQHAVKTIAVIGPDAYPTPVVGGGSAAVAPFGAVSFLEGLSEYLGGSTKVLYKRGLPTHSEMADATAFTTEATGGQPGLQVEIFNNSNFSGKSAATRVDQHINVNRSFGDGLNTNEVSARWTGYFTPSAPGEYLLFAQGPGEEGGMRLFLDDKLTLDDWSLARARISQVHLSLSAGPHKIRFEYFVHGSWGGPAVKLGILRPDAVIDPEAREIAAHSDAAVVSVGFDAESESEGGDRMFDLPPAQDELIEAIAAANKKTVVVVTAGGAVATDPWLSSVPALLLSWFPGQEAGTALAQLLFGEYSPSGKLPITYDRRLEDSATSQSYYPAGTGKKIAYSEGIFLGYRHYDLTGLKPAFPFGYGLSYTTFAYSHLAVSSSSPGRVQVSFDVSNTGSRAGAETAQVYVRDRHAPVPRPDKELKGFTKLFLKPGETRRVSLLLDDRAFSYYDVSSHGWRIAPGEFEILVGGASAKIELSDKIRIGKP